MVGQISRPGAEKLRDENGMETHPHVFLIIGTYIVYFTDCFLFYAGAVRDMSRMFTVYQSLIMVPLIWITCDLVVAAAIRLYRRLWLRYPTKHPMLDMIAMAVMYTVGILFVATMTASLYLTACLFPREFVEGYSWLNALKNGTQIAVFTGLSTLASWKFGIKDLKVLCSPWIRLAKFSTRKALGVFGK